MDVILLQDVDKVGYKYEVVNVKPGYGRNFLIPKGLALIANNSNMARLAEFNKREDHSAEKRKGEIQEIADKLKDTVLKIGAKVGETGQIFGSVTNLQLAQAMEEQFGIDIDRRKINIMEDVKSVGTYSAELILHKDIETILNFEVVAE